MKKPESHYDEIRPVCPYCGYEDSDVWEVHAANRNWSPGDELVVECPDCERKYTLVWNVSYDTEPTEASK